MGLAGHDVGAATPEGEGISKIEEADREPRCGPRDALHAPSPRFCPRQARIVLPGELVLRPEAGHGPDLTENLFHQ